jgi:TP901-1 family phage major tail protein
MAGGYSGRLMLIRMDISGTKTTIAGLRDTSLSVNDSPVDTTTKDDSGVRQFGDFGNIKRSVSVSGTGVLKDDAAIAAVRTAALASTHKAWDIVIPGDATSGGTFSGNFVITSFEESGSHDGEQQYTISLESAGAVTFTAAS